ncbi:hypothetical protein ASD04_00145 [Devosia sp. Root436]|uniref:HK97 family phage prohead protease n=1 Tax=Devosia sp. Root436 TaxID=1736537 RepID=UPI0007015B0A|nr:HK97 family phage prohead protease [Devosia sp. Root436]KQX42420.1 hypothetical protein ASD04_00145 [Devosia sp. Root436]
MNEYLTIESAELRFAVDAATGEFEGYAAIFSEVLPRYGERVMPGAFTRTLAAFAGKKRLPPMFWNHKSDEPIGVWTSMTEDRRGLKVTGKLVTTTTRGAEVLEWLKADMPLGMSIGFRAVADRQVKGIRELSEIDLIEVSLTANPASDNARVTKFRNSAEPADLAAFIKEVRRASASLR